MNNDISIETGDLDATRISNLFKDNKLSKLLNGVLLLIKGTPFVMFGDELELKGTSEIDKIMQWDDSLGCGFTDDLDIGEHFQSSTDCANNAQNVQANSLVELYKALSKLREERSFAWGDMNTLLNNNEHIIAFAREAKGHDKYLVIVNTGEHSETVSFQDKYALPATGAIVYSYSAGETGVGRKLNQVMNINEIAVESAELLIVKIKKN